MIEDLESVDRYHEGGPKEFLIGYYNWYDGVIQFTTQLANNGLEAMKLFNLDPKSEHINDEEQYCQYYLKQHDFIGYLCT